MKIPRMRIRREPELPNTRRSVEKQAADRDEFALDPTTSPRTMRAA